MDEVLLTIRAQAIAEAYAYFDLNPRTSADEFIISRYRARLQDTHPSMQPRVKEMLKRIGQTRQSRKLNDAATDSMFPDLFVGQADRCSYGDVRASPGLARCRGVLPR